MNHPGVISHRERVLEALVANIHDALGDHELRLSPVELVERCKGLRDAVCDLGIVSLRPNRERLRKDIKRSKRGMQAGPGSIPVDRGLLSTILDVLDDIEAAR